jgi:serine/threonine protein kinase
MKRGISNRDIPTRNIFHKMVAKTRPGLRSVKSLSDVCLDIQEESTESVSSSYPQQQHHSPTCDDEEMKQRAVSVQAVLDAMEGFQDQDDGSEASLSLSSVGKIAPSQEPQLHSEETLSPEHQRFLRQQSASTGEIMKMTKREDLASRKRRHSEYWKSLSHSTLMMTMDLHAEISPSSTVHVRPRLELAMEERTAQETNRRILLRKHQQQQQDQQRLSASVSVDDTMHNSNFGLGLDLDLLDASASKDLLLDDAHKGDDELLLEDPFEAACQVAKEQYEQDFANSNIVDLTRKFPQFDLNEIMLGLVLGKGSFAQVIEVKGFALKPPSFSSSSSSSSTVTSRNDSARNFTSSMRQKRQELAGVEYQEESEDVDGIDEEEDRPLSRALGFQDISDDELDIEELTDKVSTRGSLIQRDGTSRSSSSCVNRTRRTRHSTSSTSMDSSRHFIATHCHRAKEGQPTKAIARYALKQLKRNVAEDPHTFMQGVADMATETRVLSSLTDHPNIIKLRGIARGSQMPFGNDYFILMDRLYDTLERRIEKWQRLEQKLSGVHGLVRDFSQTKRTQLWMDRVIFTYDLSSALAYLHSKHVMHRDLKPPNVGFDLRGDIKIFDFGLAKELPTINNGPDDLFRFTMMCGSPRYVSCNYCGGVVAAANGRIQRNYNNKRPCCSLSFYSPVCFFLYFQMAPEVGTEERYNELCDVYSLGVLIWQMMSLCKPYDNMTMVDLVSDVWKKDPSAKRPTPSLVKKGRFLAGRGRLGGKRKQQRGKPTLGSPASLQSLVESCWSYNLQHRPGMRQVEGRLKDEILAFQAIHGIQDSRRMSHVRRRSTYIFEEDEQT